MNAETDFQTLMADQGLASHFRNAAHILVEEIVVLGVAVQQLIATGNHISNKNIIANLLVTLEETQDVIKADIIRKTIEIVVGHTLDDL